MVHALLRCGDFTKTSGSEVNTLGRPQSGLIHPGDFVPSVIRVRMMASQTFLLLRASPITVIQVNNRYNIICIEAAFWDDIHLRFIFAMK